MSNIFNKVTMSVLSIGALTLFAATDASAQRDRGRGRQKDDQKVEKEDKKVNDQRAVPPAARQPQSQYPVDQRRRNDDNRQQMQEQQRAWAQQRAAQAQQQQQIRANEQQKTA